MAGATKLMTAGGGGVTLTPASSIASDVTVNVPVTGVNGGTLVSSNSSGNVGIGITAPSAKLHVAGDIIAGDATTGSKIYPYYLSSTNYTAISSNGSGDMTFWTGTSSPASRMLITSSGDLRVATGTDYGAATASVGTDKHGVYGICSSNTTGNLYGVRGQSAVISTYGSGGVFGYSINNNTYGILGYWSTSAYWSLYGNGNAYITGTYQGSDARLKENVKDITGSLGKLTALRPVEFDWKQSTDQAKSGLGHDFGLIAQEVLPIMPEIVKEIDARQPDEGVTKTLNEELGKFYTIEYSRLIPHLINAVQELSAKVEAQQVEIELLKGTAQ